MTGIVNSTGARSGIIGTTVAPAIGTGTDGYVFTGTGAGVNPAWEAAAAGGGGKVLGFHSSIASESQTMTTTSFVAIDYVWVTLPVTESGSKMLMSFTGHFSVPATAPWCVVSFGKSSTSGGTYSELTGETWGLGFHYHTAGAMLNNLVQTFSYVHTHGESVDTDIFYKLMAKQDPTNFGIGQNDADSVLTVMEISTA